MHEPKITVVIPTRGRCDVLEKALRTVTSQDYDNLKIIVSDNFSNDGTEELVRSFDDKRIQYLNTGQRISMSHNWEFAVSHVSEGWVTIIGDDDGLLPDSLRKVARIVQATDVKAIRSKVCYYAWPGLKGNEIGLLKVPLASGQEVRDARAWLFKVLNGHADYTELPMLYNGGYVDVSVLNEIRRRTGAVYRSFNPDIYSAISIASVVDRYVFSNEPLAINGLSKHSIGTSHFARARLAEISPARVFASEGNIPLHKDIPRCPDRGIPASMHALVYESYLQSQDLREVMPEDIHAVQLEIILRSAGVHGTSVAEWGRVFAAQHGLAFERIRSKANRGRSLRMLGSISRRLREALDTYYVGSMDLPKDVYQASLAVVAIRNARPNRFRVAQALFRRVTEKAQIQ